MLRSKYRLGSVLLISAIALLIRPVRNIICDLKKMVERSFDGLPPRKNPLHYIQEYPQRTKQLLGISYNQFVGLLAQAELRHAQQQAEIERTKMRVIAKGGGRKPKLTIPEEVCLCLFYLRQLPTFEVL